MKSGERLLALGATLVIMLIASPSHADSGVTVSHLRELVANATYLEINFVIPLRAELQRYYAAKRDFNEHAQMNLDSGLEPLVAESDALIALIDGYLGQTLPDTYGRYSVRFYDPTQRSTLEQPVSSLFMLNQDALNPILNNERIEPYIAIENKIWKPADVDLARKAWLQKDCAAGDPLFAFTYWPTSKNPLCFADAIDRLEAYSAAIQPGHEREGLRLAQDLIKRDQFLR